MPKPTRRSVRVTFDKGRWIILTQRHRVEVDVQTVAFITNALISLIITIWKGNGNPHC